MKLYLAHLVVLILLILDDGHLANENISFMARLCKDRQTGHSHPRVLFFSESGRVISSGSHIPWGQPGSMIEPWDQPRKVEWRPDLPDTQQIVDDLKRCHVHLDSPSVMFLFNWCGGNYGIMTRALQWVQEQQHLRLVL